ncbi:MAG: DUF4932 domain-containing protein, partial [Sediminibacterium sp.]
KMKKAILLILTTLVAFFSNAQQIVFKTESNQVKIIRSDRNTITNWTLLSEAKPDIYDVFIPKGKTILVKYKSLKDSVSFQITSSSVTDFIIIDEKGDSCHQRIKGYEYIPKAIYSKSFIKANKDKVDISIPEVYELVSVIIALTQTGESENGLVNKDDLYYVRVKDYFKPFMNDTIISEMDKFIKENGEYYLRTNAYAFQFSKSGKIERSKVYNRIVYTDDEPNYLLPFVARLQNFSDKSNFRYFYKKEEPFYNTRITFMRDSLNYSEMINWLEKHFPTTRYDYHNIIFSPLTGYNQGMIWFDYNGFKELQPHVDFPLPVPPSLVIDNSSKIIYRGEILFTELNHGYVNKEADKYDKLISAALENKRDKLISPDKGRGYYGSASETFKEYMNWALVSLRYIDYCSEKDLPTLLAMNENYMLKRGFTQFPAFQKFIIELYSNRDKQQNLAGLYPKIIDWFSKL